MRTAKTTSFVSEKLVPINRSRGAYQRSRLPTFGSMTKYPPSLAHHNHNHTNTNTNTNWFASGNANQLAAGNANNKTITTTTDQLSWAGEGKKNTILHKSGQNLSSHHHLQRSNMSFVEKRGGRKVLKTLRPQDTDSQANFSETFSVVDNSFEVDNALVRGDYHH